MRLTLLALISLPLLTAPAAASAVFLRPDQAAKLVAQGATVLDARGLHARPPYIAGAQVIAWETLRDHGGKNGQLDANTTRMRAQLTHLGVSTERPVLVYGAMDKGWGEEGRLWWTLRYLGHRRVYVLDGGIAAWLKQRLPTTKTRPQPKSAGVWKTSIEPALRIDLSRQRGAKKNQQVIDSRTPAEFGGATPYGEQRGGHLPGAIHLYWKTLIGKDGLLLDRRRLLALLDQRGIDRTKPIAVYCTGGVRSAFVVAVMHHLGLEQAQNDDGSFWRWAQDPNLPVSK